MNTQSVANNPAGPTKQAVPEIHSFELDKNAIGKIKNGVNYFRGEMQLPVDFLTLTGYKGLDVKISAMYSSAIKNQVNTWNCDAPTGTLGLGWEMPVEYISVYKGSSGNSGSDRYYLIANGSANPLVKVGNLGDNIWQFQTRNYKFWDIQYNTDNEQWQIIKEDGSTYSYGGNNNNNAIQHGVKWGNWIGDSAEASGQQQYCSAWNLASIKSPWGNKVSYSYDNVEQSVGSNGLSYTQASYIKTVVDSYGRTISFNYQEKYGANNPSAKGIVEYQAQNAQFVSENGFQDRYETRYLDSVSIANSNNEALYSIGFSYDFINMAQSSNPQYSLLWKRVLTSVYQYAPNGSALPGMRFDYNEQNQNNQGALKAVTYPTGAVASIVYKKLSISSPKRVTVKNPLPGSVPGVWHGDDYVVFTYCQAQSSGVNVLIRTWQGQWIEHDLTVSGMSSVQADPQSMNVLMRENFIAVSFRNTAANQDQLYIYTRDNSRFGQWQLYNQQPYLLNVNANAKLSTFVAGNDFISAYNKDYSNGIFQSFSYSWQKQQWSTPVVKPTTAGDAAVIAATQNYLITARYFASQKQLKFELLYRDLVGDWQPIRTWSTSNIDILESDGKFLYSLIAAPSGAVLTHVTSADNNDINYQVTTFQWDENFYINTARGSASVELSSPIVNNKPIYQIFETITNGALVHNNTANLVNVGVGSAATWLKKDFINPASGATINTASGNNVALLCENNNGSQKNQLLTFNPNYPSQSGWQSASVTQAGSYPTITNNVATVGSTIYLRNFQADWVAQSSQINTTAEQTIQNRAPNCLVYQDSTNSNANSYFIAVKNGQVSPAVALPGGAQKTYVPEEENAAVQGANLVGARFVVSYSSDSFYQADQLFLQNLDEGDVSDYASTNPVAYIELADDQDPQQSFVQSYFYGNSNESQVVYDATTGVSQYPKVIEAAGLKSTGNQAPSSYPFGRTERYFSNGLSSQSGLYPDPAWSYNYQNLLNGMLLAQKEYDQANSLRSSQLNYWQVFTDNANSVGDKLYGGYTRLIQNNNTLDGVPHNYYKSYDEKSGLPIKQEEQYYDSDGQLKSLRKETKYAWQVPQYQAAFSKAHLLTPVAQETTSVAAVGSAPVRNYTKCVVTTYQDWADSLADVSADASNCYQDAYQKYVWTSPGTNAPSFDFSDANTNENWQLLSTVISRAAIGGLITEQTNVDGVATSYIYDSEQRYQVAKFPVGSISGGEVDYYGFESYEQSSHWQLGEQATLIPNQSDNTIDAHTGTNSLSLSANTQGTQGLSKTFTPKDTSEPYIFSAWVKKPENFDNSQGNGQWQIAIAGGQTLTVEFPQTLGQWQYISQVFELNSSNASVTISANNLNTQCNVLIDNLRFSPLDSQCVAAVYDTLNWKTNAILGANGETERTVYDAFEQAKLQTNAADSTNIIKTNFYSRQAGQGAYLSTSPNHQLAIQPAAGGEVNTFTRGNEWQKSWQGDSSIWQVNNGQLTQQHAEQAGSLALCNAKSDHSFALAARFENQEKISAAFGVKINDSISITWQPTSCAWQLSGVENAPENVQTTLFTLPAATFAAQLNNNEVSAELMQAFTLANYPLLTGATVEKGNAGDNSWQISSANGRYYYQLIEQNNAIEVYRLANHWHVLVDDKNLAFWADGELIFSYRASEQISAKPSVFFGNKVVINQLASAYQVQAQVSFNNDKGLTIQAQKLDSDQMITSQIVNDAFGRAAINSKQAYLSATEHAMFSYCDNFANFNWQSGQMTGLISQAFPEDDGYSYGRQVFECSPLARLLKTGNPGAAFEVNAKPTTYQYSNEDNKFNKTISINPNGDIYYELYNQLKQLVSKVSIIEGHENTTTTLYDDAANAVEIRSPNYFKPPVNSTAEDWLIKQSFDFNGRMLSSVSGQQGATQYIYDRAGRIRFVQDPQGASSENYNYVKYNRAGQDIEKGYLSGAWHGETLQQTSDTDATWPASPETWRQKLYYNGNAESEQAISHAIGRVYKVEVNNSDDGVADVIEHFVFDIFGNTTKQILAVTEFAAGQENSVSYVYDNLANKVAMTYPDGSTIYFKNDQQNQVSAMSEQADFSQLLASFSYTASGQVAQEVVNLVAPETGEASHALSRNYQYNSPLWLENIAQQSEPLTNQGSSQQTSLINEALTYTENGYNNSGYFDGNIASATTTAASDIRDSADTSVKYAVDSLGYIMNAQNSEQEKWSLALDPQNPYDSNGNFNQLTLGSDAVTYQYEKGLQQVEKVTDNSDGKTLASYSYDLNGNAITAQSSQFANDQAHDLKLSYDPGSKMTTRITDNEQTNLAFLYGKGNQRVLKSVNNQAGGQSKKLYIRGINQRPIAELVQTEDASGSHNQQSHYFYGPSGLIAFRKNNNTYAVTKDHLGSITSVVDEKANVVASYEYLTFGALAKVSQPEADFLPYLFTGQEFESEIGMYNFGARFYAAELGRFIATDPDKQFFSPYIYAANNPVLYIDPTGRFSIGSFFSAIAGVVIGAVEILIGVAVDVVAGILEVVTGGLATPAAMGLAAVAGAFYGAGVSSITYSVFNANDFNWNDYGTEMGIGAAVGFVTGGLSVLAAPAAGSVAAATTRSIAEAGEPLTYGAKAANYAKRGVLWAANKAADTSVSPGWKGAAKDAAVGIAKSEAIGISKNTAVNLATGNDWDDGLGKVVFSSALSGAVSGTSVKTRSTNATNNAINAMAAF